MEDNLAVGDELIESVLKTGTKKEAVTAALDQYIERRKQLRILESFGTVAFDPTYDYKAERRKKRS